ncbi:hypothetical protein Pla123a_18540 [Posidoniimonas polymericola]|uniref:PEGA domain protein n=1 Tax=Posidoniimonas polymericola TaxID=2528002 RepID=A0A5C5YQS6_9BACT|nr:hypothetical protein [Posidoniimonas polymericola]TWT77199.1 hypothetical protein Pla123a_18540 [Posidoniimonas polymericola]
MIRRTALLLLVAPLMAGCFVSGSSYRASLASQLSKSDGSTLRVECVTDTPHDATNISSTMTPRPGVTVVMDARTFVVYEDRVTLNGEPIAELKPAANKVRIEIDANGYELLVDGQQVAAAD